MKYTAPTAEIVNLTAVQNIADNTPVDGKPSLGGRE